MRGVIAGATLLAFSLPVAASAQQLRDFCPDRPGLGTPSCTVDKGHSAVEIGIGDWTRDSQAGTRTDTLEIGELLFRHGLDDSLELQVGWNAFGYVRTRTGSTVTNDSGIGDVTVALRQNLQNPDGSGFSIALMPYATLPTGGTAIGAGDWSAGLILPMSHDLPSGLNVQFTGSVAAAVDADREGRHLAYGGIVGLAVPASNNVGIEFEISGQRNDDPAGATTQWVGGLSAGWTPNDNLQLDIGTNIGFNRSAPGFEIYFGVARRF